MTTETLSQWLQLNKPLQEYLDKRVAEEVEKAVAAKLASLALNQSQSPKNQPRKVAIAVSKGTLDMAYPPLLLATAAASLGAEVVVYFTLYGLNLLRKTGDTTLKVAPVGNPAMPVPVPNIIGMLPGMTALATSMMKGMIAKQHVQTIPELLKEAQELKVKFIACRVAMNVLGVKKEKLIEGVEVGDPENFLQFGFGADITLFI